jgi:hypothetical protein
MRCSAILSQDGSNRYGTVGPVTPAMTPFSPSANPLTPGRHDDTTASYGLGTTHEEVTDQRVTTGVCGMPHAVLHALACGAIVMASRRVAHLTESCCALRETVHCSSAVGLLHCSAHC